jgi:hypothetical protein
MEPIKNNYTFLNILNNNYRFCETFIIMMYLHIPIVMHIFITPDILNVILNIKYEINF